MSWGEDLKQERVEDLELAVNKMLTALELASDYIIGSGAIKQNPIRILVEDAIETGQELIK